MKNENVFKNRYFEDISHDLKAILFDVIAEAENRLEKLEYAVSKDANIDRQGKLNEIWLTINDGIKQIVNASNKMEDSLKHIDLYCHSCDAFLNEERIILDDIDKAVTKNEEGNITEAIEFEKQEENVVEKTKTPTVESPEAVTSEDIKEVVETASVVEEPQQETNETTEVVQVEEKAEGTETPTVESPEEVTSEDSKEEVETASVVEEPQQETNETTEVEQVEEKAEGISLIPTIVQSVVEVQSEENKVESEADEETKDKAKEVIKPVLELPIIDEKKEIVETQPENAETKLEIVEATPTIAVELPVIENSNLASVSQENISTELVKEEVTDDEVINVDIPAIDEKQTIEVDDILEDAQYYIDINGEGNPILINKKQANHLRESLPVQRVLFSERISKSNTIVDDTLSEQKLEEMLNQIPILYEQGKVEEAEAMTEKVSAYSKKLQQAT